MKLDHIQLAMPEGEEEKARSFFSGILGMVEDEKPYPLNERGGCWFRKGGVILHIGVDKNYSPQKKAHPAFVVPNLNELEKKLKEKDFEAVWDGALQHRTRFYSSDPFGNRIEFMKDGDGFSQK
ncbi:hypothetical protein [Pelagicoccus sp. SDUM812002]|uniref:hypothetical protein n=1 Tax=Pelagicoccus sp. SDUM812002 TaxID=3041266 RepID=UPI00280EE5D4|nr:hypothetical protein [Pelagicoccus sp. SDUM812002]MDQ8188361.1 hypothetical protein [Pelagicoccus sp. SDUM812002]